jgi:two-component system chemotaxis sensor kinase CheA
LDQTLGSINWALNNIEAISAKKRENILSSRREESMLVIIETSMGLMAIPVEDVLGQAQVVVKPLVIGQQIPEVAGAAILGDGKTVLILDPGALANRVAKLREVAA